MDGLTRFCSESTSLSEAAIASVLDSLRIYIARELRSNCENQVRIDKLGTFSSKVVPAHIGRNPRTGAAVDVPEKCRPVFKFSNSFIKSVQPFDPNSAEQFEDETEESSKSLAVSTPVSTPVFAEVTAKTNFVKNWYAALPGNTIELPETALVISGVDKETLVWREGMTGWEYAGKVAELAYLFVSQNPFPPLPVK